MKKSLIAWAMLIAAGMMLVACGPAATPEPPTPTSTPTVQPSATPTNTPVPEPTPTEAPSHPPVDMLAWLLEHPFAAATNDFQAEVLRDQFDPPIDVGELPDGFIVTESRGGVAYLPDGEAYVWSTKYLYPVDNQVSLENDVGISIFAHTNEAVREYHYGVMARNREAFLVNVGEYEVLYFFDQTTIGHIWLSGPYTVIVGSAPPIDGTPNAWLTIFSELLVDLYPPENG